MSTPTDPTERPVSHETPGAYPGTKTAVDRVTALVARMTDASDVMVRKADLRELLGLAASAPQGDTLREVAAELAEGMTQIAVALGMNVEAGEVGPIVDRVRQLVQRAKVPDEDALFRRATVKVHDMSCGCGDWETHGEEQIERYETLARGVLAERAFGKRVSAAEQIEDMIARLAAADIGWCRQFGDVPAQPAYIKSLATQMCAFEPPLSAPAPADDEAAQVERVARAALVAESQALASVAKAVGLPEDVDAEAIVHQVHELVAALAALKEGQR